MILEDQIISSKILSGMMDDTNLGAVTDDDENGEVASLMSSSSKALAKV